MLEQPRVFGAELRRLRIGAGLSLTQLAAAVHYSKGQLSKIETGRKRPTVELARLCDAALDAQGTLAALVPVRPPRAETVRPYTRPGTEGTSPAAEQSLPHPGSPAPPSRRQVIAIGAASVLSAGAGEQSPGGPPLAQEESVAGAYRALLDQYRRIGQMSPPDTLLPVLAEQTHALRRLATRSGSRCDGELLALAAHFAVFTGWLAQEAGDEGAALRWTAHAVDLADASGDRDLASYALVRRALVTYYRGEAADTVALAVGARSPELPPRIRGLAAQREAQGHALAGDHDACMRGLERARLLLDQDPGAAGAPVLGTTHLGDPVSMITGWCLLDLGRPRAAAEILDRECGRLPTVAWRTQARYGVRRALAHAVAGEIDHACALTEGLLPLTTSVSSATVATDLRRLARTLARHPRNRSYLSVAPHLTAALTLAP
ncbi:helix-turn-helix domain-containing protein [Streptomyces sp. ISL-22]|uniref:helix-turn-helix domain-containing protein n=1 Tax=unclassified Streptomyces TaxID=2593676 RepID=UPI001BE7678F|nr:MULTISPECIES: helix-turn-helix transcriptional regulator [unclassified Streptomyces]MBT2419824.1 helix-turn-helix domain-containing protein [Streptomyces sp. ISL-24]MBT2435211.1 helix-turn-helix domain-containing protein [Streptomyces sp. ISL-22]